MYNDIIFIRELPHPARLVFNATETFTPVKIQKWSVGPHKPTKERTLLLYKEMDLNGGLSGGGESLRTPYDKK